MRWLAVAVLAGCSFRAGSYADEQMPDARVDARADMTMIGGDVLGDATIGPAGKVRLVDVVDGRVAGGPHADFPVLIASSEPWLKSKANQGDVASDSGHDIYFATDLAGANRLDHEVELYSAAAGTLIAWVRVPSLTATTSFYIHYGDPAFTTSQQDVVGTWSAYDFVMHFDGVIDSVAGSTNVPSNTFTVGDQNGRIDRARELDGLDDRIDMGSATAIDNIFVGGGTVEAWVYPQTYGGGLFGRIADKGNNPAGWSLFIDNGNAMAGFTNTVSFIHGSNNGTPTFGFYYAASGSMSTGAWHHIALNFNKDAITNLPVMFIDGVQTIVFVDTSPSGSFISDANATLLVGNRASDLARGFDGLFDEYRMAATERSSGWIQTAYRNQADPGGFYMIGDPL